MQKLENGNGEQTEEVGYGEEGGKIREVSPPWYQSMCESCRTKGPIGKVQSAVVTILIIVGNR